ncbi:MAG: acyl carrier protein [Lachnospiraceae bacterium]|nr:acyl carrier protein [Lachnospiraceae bacterium]
MEFEKLCEIVEDVLHVNKKEITENTSFIRDLSADSLDLFEIYEEIGRTFELEIDMDEADSLITVGDVLKYIQSTHREIS